MHTTFVSYFRNAWKINFYQILDDCVSVSAKLGSKFNPMPQPDNEFPRQTRERIMKNRVWYDGGECVVFENTLSRGVTSEVARKHCVISFYTSFSLSLSCIFVEAVRGILLCHRLGLPDEIPDKLRR